MNPKATCPTCGNGMFHNGLSGHPFWCGACNTRTHAPVWVCPKCGRRLAKGVGADTYLDPGMGCPPAWHR